MSKMDDTMHAAEVAGAVAIGGLGFLAADGLDRFLSSYNPSSPSKPSDKFVSDPNGAGTLANVLNHGASPNWKRGVAAVGAVLVPAGASLAVDEPVAKASLEAIAIGAGISGVRLLVENVILPAFVPKDATTPALQKSIIARLVPAQVAAKMAMAQRPSTTGALSAPADIGPFAMSDSPAYPDAGQALAQRFGQVSGESKYADASEALRAGLHDYPDAAEALRQRAGVSAPYTPGPPSLPGPGPSSDSEQTCGCVGDRFAGFLGKPSSDSDLPLVPMRVNRQAPETWTERNWR